MPGTVRQEIIKPNWKAFDPLDGLECLPALAFPLLLGIAKGDVGEYATVVAGAFTVGFGSFQQTKGSRLSLMLAASFGMSAASWAGTLAGSSPTAVIWASAAMAGLYATLSHLSPAASWAALQCGIYFVISTAYPAHGRHAWTRGLLVLSGGLLQTLFMAGWSRLRRTSAFGAPASPPAQAQPFYILFIARVTLTITIAAALYQWLSAQNGYWIPMNALIVIRPGFHDSMTRGFARMLGTMAGAAVATVLIRIIPPGHWSLACGALVFAWLSYALSQVNYACFAGCLTAYIAFLLSLVGIPEEQLILHRVLFTALGGGLAFGLHWAATKLMEGQRPQPA